MTSPDRITHSIDFTYFNLWHYDGRTSKHGAFKGGADFVQWHGTNCFRRRLNSNMMPPNCGENMRTTSLLACAQKLVVDPRGRRMHDPQLWVDLFVTLNLAILAADIYIAHSVNHFQKAAEFMPLYFSIGSMGVHSSCFRVRCGPRVARLNICMGSSGRGTWGRRLDS